MYSKTVLFYLATVALVAVSVAGHDGYTLPGLYVLATPMKDDNFGKYLLAIGVPAVTVKHIQKGKRVEVKITNPSGENWEVEHRTDGGWPLRLIFESGKEFDAERPDMSKYKNTISVDRETHTAKRVIPLPGGEAANDIKFNPDPDGGFTATLKFKEATAVLKFDKATELKWIRQ